MRRLPLLLCAIGVLAFAGYASGATINVTTTEPGINADGLCSFEEAVDNVREGNVHTDCVVGETTGNTIELGEGLTYLVPVEENWEYDAGAYSLMILGNGSTLEGVDLLTGGPEVTIRDLNTFNSEIWWSAGESASSPTGFLKVESCEFASGLGLGILVGVNAERVGTDIVDTVFRGAPSTFGVLINDSSPTENQYRFVDCDFLGTGYGVYFGAGAGFLSIDGCRFDDNDPGGVIVEGKVVEITRSSFSHNYYGVHVGWHYFTPPETQSSVVVSSCTFSDNYHGVKIVEPNGPSPGSVRIRHSTFVQNGYALGGWLDGISIEATILDDVSIYHNLCDVYSYPETSPSSGGFNIAGDSSCNLDHHTDMILDDAMLSEFGDYGGRTLVHMPLEGSPVIDMGNTICPRTDQRGYKRPTDGDGDGVAVCDCGAVEYNSYPLPIPYEHEAVAAVDE